jgi:uncharacterized protein (DUF1330 family)
VGTVDAEPGSLHRFLERVPEGAPVVLVNLHRYRRRAALEDEELTGRQAYERYAGALEPVLRAVGGRPIFRAQVRHVLIGPPGERWDEVILVAYPRRGAFDRLVAAPQFGVCAHLRTAALEDSRLIAATAPQNISRAAWWLLGLATSLRRSSWGTPIRPRRPGRRRPRSP